MAYNGGDYNGGEGDSGSGDSVGVYVCGNDFATYSYSETL